MDLQDIRQILKDFNTSALTKLNLEWDGVKLQLEKEPFRNVQETNYGGLPLSEPVAAKATVEQTDVESEEHANETPVKSPVVGVFYAASSPKATPFVTVGQHVDKGQVLCIVEAMKMMNEITAPVSGTVASILVEQEAAVEYDQVLMTIK